MRRRDAPPRFVLLLPILGGLLLAACPQPEAEDEEPGPEADDSGARSAGSGAEPADGALLELATAAHGFPSLQDLEGRPLAQGEFAQWMEEDRLHMRIRYDFEDDRWIEEAAVVGEGRVDGRPGLVQEAWTWEESRAGQRVRRFEVDFAARTATGEKRAEAGVERWSEELEVEPGQTFAGFAFTLAIAERRERLVDGEALELQAVVFTPEPRVVDVELTHGGTERLRMAGRTVSGDRFDIVPQVPWVAELFVESPDTRIWLTRPPAGFLRWEGPLMEPDDPTVRVDLLPSR